MPGQVAPPSVLRRIQPSPALAPSTLPGACGSNSTQVRVSEESTLFQDTPPLVLRYTPLLVGAITRLESPGLTAMCQVKPYWSEHGPGAGGDQLPPWLADL